MKLTEEQKQVEILRKAKWCSHVNTKLKVIGIFSDNTSMKFGNYSKEVKNLTKKLNYSVQLVIAD